MTTADKTRKKSWASGMDLVNAGLMKITALHQGVADGIFSPDPNTRDYGEDNNLYEQVEKFLSNINAKAQGFTFTCVGRKILTDAEKAERKANRKSRTPAEGK
jgi:hypothetical protein